MKEEFYKLHLALKKVESDATAWRDVCDAVSDCFGAVGTIIMGHDPDFRGVWLFQSKTLETVTNAYVANGWQYRDLRQKLIPKLRVDYFACDDDLGDRRSLMKLPYFRDFLGSRGLGYGAIIGLKIQDNIFGLSMQFQPDRHSITAKEKQLASEVRQMVAATAELLASKAEHQFLSLIEMMSQTVDELAVFNVTGRATFSSKVPLDQFDPSAWPMDEIKAACSANPASYGPKHVVMEQSGLTRRFNILQLPSSLRHFFTEDKVIVLAIDTAATSESRRSQLSALYQLTESELACTELLAAGNSADEIASTLGLRTSTIRQRLKGILSKTGTSSQAKLVSLFFQL
ncbi:LuxR C-terminal-related transcriptional regulator [Cognatiyoonia sp. IB215446]|uniref:LuxR C-terminal-related transcriptional regulator n=1 Tax=Cognatiyoonia sp. IB215446 TaxID=3097355 RepID=UPI002A15137C|nr:LuxR C-terminal-related transcriptional regulator [Cognatiyoonia sp. IB215446]MDX8348896.1 LuxR C-terminal-related transcriptional regulator [Cognatiyoonia sp. IB215446]